MFEGKYIVRTGMVRRRIKSVFDNTDKKDRDTKN